jgi:hypothetical protein
MACSTITKAAKTRTIKTMPKMFKRENKVESMGLFYKFVKILTQDIVEVEGERKEIGRICPYCYLNEY